VDAVKKKATSDANLNVSRNHVKNLQMQIDEAMNMIYALCAICGDEFRMSADALKLPEPYVAKYDPEKEEWIFKKMDKTKDA
jgi:transcription elongation factor Elf1